ncbi:MAG TPA: MarR family winged helix-turn-helix transcriptional regulator [Naasia sp.]|jgi:DNA-binding MarR family transcriptional regulator
MARSTARGRKIDPATLDLLVAFPTRLSRLHTAILAGLDPRLTFRQYRTLSRVAEGATSMGQLAARGNLTLPTVSENVDGLVRRGLMITTPSQHDRRAVVLGVTDAGLAAVAAADEALSEFIHYLTDDLSAADLDATVATMGRMYEKATIYFQDQHIDRNA